MYSFVHRYLELNFNIRARPTEDAVNIFWKPRLCIILFQNTLLIADYELILNYVWLLFSFVVLLFIDFPWAFVEVKHGNTAFTNEWVLDAFIGLLIELLTYPCIYILEGIVKPLLFSYPKRYIITDKYRVPWIRRIQKCGTVPIQKFITMYSANIVIIVSTNK